MTLIDRITKPVAPNGNLDDALEAEARIQTLANSAPRNSMPSPFDIATHPAPAKQFSLSLTPVARGITINTTHPLESTVEEIGGRITISIKW